MTFSNNTYQPFFAILRAGLWDKLDNEFIFQPDVDWAKIMHMAME